MANFRRPRSRIVCSPSTPPRYGSYNIYYGEDMYWLLSTSTRRSCAYSCLSGLASVSHSSIIPVPK